MIDIESYGIIPLRYESGTWQVLLILHSEGRHWSFPKGKKDLGETDREAAIRELKEETQLEVVRFIQETPFIENYQFRRHGKPVTKRVHYFPAEVRGTLKLQPEEIRDAKWLPLKLADHQLTFREAKRILSQLLLLLNEKP